ncbi:MAG TPA: DUF5985 family protein [Polyangia bacterium]|jgi:hypothetical protein
MAETVYILCTLASSACALLLLRGYRASKSRLLFWSSLCFSGLALNNALLFFDLVVVPSVDLVLVRGGVALAAVAVLLFGFIWDAP